MRKAGYIDEILNSIMIEKSKIKEDFIKDGIFYIMLVRCVFKEIFEGNLYLKWLINIEIKLEEWYIFYENFIRNWLFFCIRNKSKYGWILLNVIDWVVVKIILRVVFIFYIFVLDKSNFIGGFLFLYLCYIIYKLICICRIFYWLLNLVLNVLLRWMKWEMKRLFSLSGLFELYYRDLWRIK